METAQTYSETPNLQTIWAILQEVVAKQKETDRIIKENAESKKEIDQQMKGSSMWSDKQLSKLGSFNEIGEHIDGSYLMEKFSELGLVFTKAYHDSKIYDNNKVITTVGITLENSEKVMIVDVKYNWTPDNIIEDTKKHIERMNKVRAHADKHGDNRKYLGAVAGVIMTDNERNFAFKNGFFVIEPSGETFSIRVPEGDYSIREW
jgi:hypothetical protein